ncbi:Yos1-like-domain-containing protein [Xylaria arbuscula]|nr:Yos1-like-domain-containing protein [Xylaria arbuscula]
MLVQPSKLRRRTSPTTSTREDATNKLSTHNSHNVQRAHALSWPFSHVARQRADKMMLIGNLIYVTVLLINALAILSEDRFLARINFSSASYDPAFGAGPDTQSIRVKAINLLASVRTLMRST